MSESEQTPAPVDSAAPKDGPWGFKKFPGPVKELAADAAKREKMTIQDWVAEAIRAHAESAADESGDPAPFLSDDDSRIRPTRIKGELRIRDIDLGERLGFSEPINIRKLVRRHEAALARLGGISTVEKPGQTDGGKPGTEFYLNKMQAIFVTTKSETAIATDVTIEIIQRFDAYERGDGLTVPTAVTITPISVSEIGQAIEIAERIAKLRGRTISTRLLASAMRALSHRLTQP